MAAGHQLRLLLWKDYLIRKRKLITLAGITWAIAVMLTLYIVRVNVDNQDFPTCQFPARALPSAGLVTFLQSFICSVNNECSPMSQYHEIPTYENSTLTKLQRKFSPLLYNETVLDVAGTVPDALKLLATLADIVDEPTFIHISKNGLKVQDLFTNPARIKRYIVSSLDISKDTAQSVLLAELNFQGIFKGNIDRCSTKSISNILTMTNSENIDELVRKLCSLSETQIQKMAMKLLMEVNFKKYISMIGNMYQRLSGDDRLTRLADMLTAVLHMLKLDNFVPSELVALFLGEDVDFSYFNISIISKLMDLFEPTFGDTQVYKTLRDFTDAIETGVQYLVRITAKPTSDVIDDLQTKNESYLLIMQKSTDAFQRAIAVFEESNANDSSAGVFSVLSQVTKIILKFMPDKMKHDVLFYSTLLSKLMEGALKVIDINMHIQEMAYNVSLRHPDGVKVLVGLPTHVVGKGFEALADAERTQIMTSKLNFPSQMFCDSNRLANFFIISKSDADNLKKQLCSNAWKNYVSDLIKSFGIYEVKDNINTMASLVIQSTLGKNIDDQLYSIDKIFGVVKNFTTGLSQMTKEEKNSYNWLQLFNVTEDSQFMKVVNKKGHLGKQMLITVHGALAKEVVKQNPILEFKISPTLIDIMTVVTAINEQLTHMSPDLITRLKKMYPDIIQTMLLTTLDEKKTYRCLSTPSEDIVCNGTEQSSLFLNFPEDIDQNSFISVLCETANVIEHGLKNDSVIAKAIAKVKKSKHSFESVNWTKLINNVKGLYMKLNKDFPYLFEYKIYGMDTDTQIKVTEMLEESKNFWFSWNNLERSVHLSVKLILRLLDLIDRDIFNVNDEVWIELKQYLTVTTGPFVIINDVIMEVTALLRNESYVPKLPRKTSIALNEIIPNLPQLIVDSVNVIISDKTDITPIISLMNSKPPWPCADTSISKYIKLSENSKKAVMGLETLMCLETEIQQQWIDYIDENKVNNSSSHIFLRFSTAFDLVIEDIKVLKNTLSDFSDGSKSPSNHKLTFVNAWKYAVDVIKANDQNIVFGKFFTKFDAVLNAVNTSTKDGQSANNLWEDYIKCSNNSIIQVDCMMIGRSAWKYSLQSLSIILENMAADLMTYFTEVNEPNSNLLQYIGFTRNTGLYILYDKMPEFIGTLVNSFWDYGFMTQIRRASLSEFWDCEGILDALIPLPDTGIDATTIKKVKPIICPSLLHWISLPRGDNTLLDVFAKPQYFFYTVPVQNLTSNYQSAFTKAVNLTKLLADIAKKNETRITEEDIKIHRLKETLKITVDNILSYRINETNPSYRLFNEVNGKQFHSFVYLTRILGSISKLSNALDNLTIGDINPDISEDDIKKLKADLSTIQKIFKRRPSDAIALHFDLITDVVWTNNEQYKLTNAIDAMCVNLNQNYNNKDILSENDRTKIQICAKNYKLIYGAVENVLTEDFENTRHSLLNLFSVLQNGNMEGISDIASFLKQRKQLMVSLKRSIKYAYDLGIPIYLKYLQNNLENYNVILSFLAGEDWWHELRMLYSGPQASNFFNNTENIFEIAEDILTKLDKIHIVRLLRDVDVNSSTAFCQSNVTLSDYIPDATGALSELKRSACESDKTELFKEIPPLMFASQGYDNELKISKIVNYTALNSVISKTEAKLELIKDGPRSPKRPNWITNEKISQLRTVALQLLSKETLTKVAFGMTSNIVDIGTLFLNSSQCTLCSQLTTWFKQINLQLIKKQEYDTLVCHMHTMTLEEVHHTLKNDFHWDMAFKELISSRNYTKNEMNKSVNELLEQIKLHLLEDLNANNTKLSDCLAKNVSRNEFGNSTLFIFVLAQTTRLLRAELPHIHEVEGMTDVPYFKTLASEIAHKLDVKAPLKDYLFKNSNISKELERVIHDDNVIKDILSADVNLRLVLSKKSVEDYMYLAKRDWRDICTTKNCDTVSDIIFNHVNKTFLQNNLLKLQTKEFWRFHFISDILRHIEDVINHMGRLVGLASKVDLNAAFEGKLAAIIDLVMQILTDDMLNGIAYSIKGIRKELQPVLAGTPMEYDLDAVSDGLMVLQQIKTHFIENEELKVEVATLFPDPERVESSLSRLGINNTNFWSIAAPRIHAGYLKFKPMLTTKQEEFHISKFVCEVEWMEKVIIPSNLDVVTAEDVHAAVVEQFCGISDQQAKQIISALLDNLDYKFILQKMTDFLLSKLYSASSLSQEQGAAVLDRLPQMAALLPTVQGSVGDLSDTLANEPIFQNLKDFSSVGNLISSTEFLSNAGMMLCGKPFYANINRIYKTVAQSKDLSGQLDQKQLEVLPTDFCRSLYKDIINMDGGKIVWSFVKPLIMGKILYTPDTPFVNRIIEKANSTFSHMIKLTGLVHSFAQAFSSVDKLSQHRAGVEVMRRIMTSPTFSELKASLIGGQELPDINVDGLFDDFGDLKDVGGLLSKASDLLHCVNLRRFRAMPDEDQLMHHAALLSQVDEFSAGLVFLNMDDENNLPSNIEYKIRMDIDNVPTTTRVKNYMWTPGPQSSFIEDMRYFRGFVQIQDLVDRAIIQLSQNKSRIQKRETRTDDETKWAVYTQQTPYPCYRKDFFQTSLYESQALLVAFFFSLLYTVASVVRFMVADKESGNTMLMSVMGVDLANHTASWFIVSLIEISITCACIATVLCVGGILPRSSPSMVYALLLIFGFSVLCFCYMLSKLFTSASFAAVSSAIAYLVSFMPIVLILSLEAVMSASYKIFVCLSMSSALCYAFLYVARYEAVGEGAHWAHLWASPAEGDADLSIGAAACMLLLDGLIYLAIGWLIDRFFGPKTLRSNITNCETTGEKAGVSIVNITKVYGEGSRRPKVALDNVSIELHKGQITALLGHNGAGKTTLINILTGALRPTSGHVCVRSCAGAAAAPGACPQRDVLIEQLSAREHVALYAQLKGGRRLDHLTHEVDSIMRVLSLGEVSEEPVRRLSGGTRRRVCVALAFVHAPHLVLLDEPTAGVDPAARRDIWSMIVKLKEDRTILLTTHHLDEAELLSDQIVIMHKGQVHTTGSPVEIKRTLGTGYKMSVIYPNKKTQEEPWSDDEVTIEERTKELLTVVRDVVKNASLVDVNETEVELMLPFFDANGLNNNFLSVCEAVESRRVELGYRSYSLDCSSLEQVFFSICQRADATGPTEHAIEYVVEDTPSKSGSSSSIKPDSAPLVSGDGPLTGSAWQQFLALMHIRYLHYTRNRWLLFLLVILPSLFVTIAMAFSTIRPPADNEISLRLHPGLYDNATEFIVPTPSMYTKQIDPSFSRRVMEELSYGAGARNWTEEDTPMCRCEEARQQCAAGRAGSRGRPATLLLPDVRALNEWLVNSQELYIEKRYGGFSSALKNNLTNLIAWYNNKGHHAMPSYLNALNTAVLRTLAGPAANITTYSHPLKISKEQISKNTVYQHVADAGISGLVLVAYSLVSAGAAVYLVSARTRQEKRLQLLCGVSPALYWLTALAWDMLIILINMLITVVVMEAFHFPVFVARNNLPAICVLILLYGYACGCLVHVAEKLFSEASVANMVLFCGNAFLGLAGIAILLILDIISESERTDNVRWVLHKVFMLSPQFALGDGLLEIAKNTIQAQVLLRFGMDTYRDPFSTDLMVYQCVALLLVGSALLLLNLAIEYDAFDGILARFSSETIPEEPSGELEESDVTAERRRVLAAVARADNPLRINTIGNINAGFMDTEGGTLKSIKVAAECEDLAQCVRLGKVHRGLGGGRVALRDLTLGIPPGQCTALLGANGAGKSTLFSLLTGQLRPSAGAVCLRGSRASRASLAAGAIGYCPQSDAIDPLLTVRETLVLYCRLRGIADQEEVVKRTLDTFELRGYACVRCGALSGGNRRKVCAAVAFMGRGTLVLLDEPTSGMDPLSRACVSRGVRQCCARGCAVLLSTHALDDARRLAARVALLRRGRLQALAPLDDCLTRFGGGYVVQCVVSRGGQAACARAWRRVRAAAPAARLLLLHHHTLHFLVPARAHVDKQEVSTQLSDIFRLMSKVQSICDIEDYTINQSSLDQMFLSFSDKPDVILEDIDLEPLPTPIMLRSTGQSEKASEELESVTSL